MDSKVNITSSCGVIILFGKLNVPSVFNLKTSEPETNLSVYPLKLIPPPPEPINVDKSTPPERYFPVTFKSPFIVPPLAY